MRIFFDLLKRSVKEMRSHDPLRMAGATAFFTTFALPPILFILFQLFSLFLSRRTVGSEMMEVLTSTLGRESAEQVRDTARGFRHMASNWYIAIAGFLFLLFVATTLFSIIKNSLNDIWRIKVSDKPGWRFRLLARARSLLVILFAGILFLAGILLDGFEIFAGNYIDKLLPGRGIYFKSAINEIVGAIIYTTWFLMLFRYLADARPCWRAATIGAIVTGVLFTGGKSLLSFLMRNSNIGNIYGASGSIVLILLFVFYSSFILYYGAAFIKVYSEETNQPLQLASHTYKYELKAEKP